MGNIAVEFGRFDIPVADMSAHEGNGNCLPDFKARGGTEYGQCILPRIDPKLDPVFGFTTFDDFSGDDFVEIEFRLRRGFAFEPDEGQLADEILVGKVEIDEFFKPFVCYSQFMSPLIFISAHPEGCGTR